VTNIARFFKKFNITVNEEEMISNIKEEKK